MKLCQSFYKEEDNKDFNEFEECITPSEVIQFLYCPRFSYYMKCLGIKQHEEKRYKVQVGRQKHVDKSNANINYVRKKINGVSKHQEVYLVSKKHNIKGMIDEIYLLKDGTYAPLDYKYAEYKEKEYLTYKIQMAMYSLMIEELYNCKVNSMYIVYMRSKNLIREIKFDNRLRKNCLDIIEAYKNVVNGLYPNGTKYKARCTDCCYKNIC